MDNEEALKLLPIYKTEGFTMKKEPFVIYGTYSIEGIKKGNDIIIGRVNLNPQRVFGSNVDALPKIKLIYKNKITVKWHIITMEG